MGLKWLKTRHLVAKRTSYLLFLKILGLGSIPPRLWELAGGYVFSSTRTDLGSRQQWISLWRVDYAKILLIHL
jgi:hypothetical protein